MPNVSFEKHNILELNIDKKFDVVVSVETIEHFCRQDIDSYLASLLKHLKKNGIFAVSTPFCENSGPSPITLQHLYEFNINELLELLKSNKLEILDVKLHKKPGKAGRLGYTEVICKNTINISYP